MFLSFLEPYPIRNKKAPFLWVFYKQLMHFDINDIVYIGSGDYFLDPVLLSHRDEFIEYAKFKNEYCIPSYDLINKCNKYVIDLSIYRPLEERFTNSIDIYKFLLLNEYEPLVNELRKIFSSYRDIEAVLAWANSPSLNKVAAEFNVKVIYNELGPFRKPLYLQTAYFDFRGINFNTESENRFLKFKKIKNELSLLSIKELRELFLNNIYMEKCVNKDYKLGVVLQVENDSNVIAYSNGYDNLRLIDEAFKFYKKEDILIRKHPLGLFELKENIFNIDKSENSLDFIKKCEQVLTINSSIGVESLLFEVPVCAKGESSYSFFVDNKLPAKLPEYLGDFLNFYMISYLIFYGVLYDIEYYRFRLNEFSEKEIFKKNLDIIFSVRNLSKGDDLTKQLYKYKYDMLLSQLESIKKQNDKLKNNITICESKIKKQEKIIHEKDKIIGKQLKEIDKFKFKIKQQEEVIKLQENKINDLKNEIYSYFCSTSWKITRPLRKISRFLKRR
jgi:hypothetical protein